MIKDNKYYIVHIIECIEKIEEYTVGGKESFVSNNMVYDATLRNLQIMSESTQRLGDDIKKSYANIRWREISEFRNFLVHSYGDVDPEIVWSIILDRLPELKEAMQNELKKYN